jgi:hypothetical protein
LHESQCLLRAARGKREHDWHWLDTKTAGAEGVVGEQRLRGGHVVNRLSDEEAAARLGLGEDALVLVARARVSLGDRDPAKHLRGCLLSGQSVGIGQPRLAGARRLAAPTSTDSGDDAGQACRSQPTKPSAVSRLRQW